MPSTTGIVASAYSTAALPDVPLSSVSYDDEVLADSPWLYWPLDETSGTSAADDSGNARTGTATASGLLGAGSAPPQGGVSADMNGTNEITGPTTSMSVTGGAIEAWIWLPSGGSGTRYMIAGPHNGSSAFALNLLLDNSGKARFYAFDTSAGVEKHATGATTIPEEEWVHLVGVWDNVKLYIYVNGTLDGSIGSTAPEVTSKLFRVSRTMAPSGVSYAAFPGDVAHVAVYSAELTPARIATHYLTGTGTLTVYAAEVLEDEPLGYWPMNETSGTTITDLAGSGNDGTYVNSPTLNDTAPGAGLEASVDFDGSADAGSIALDLSAYTTATVEMWLRWDTYANDDDFAMEFTANVSSNNGSFWIDPNAADGTIQVNMKGSGGFSTTGFSRSHVPAGTWAHLAFILDRNNSAGLGRARMFVNGVEKASASVTNSNNAGAFTNSTLYLMSRATTSLYGDGGMAALAIYPAALTKARIATHYVAGQGYYYDTYLADETGIVAYYPLSESAAPYADALGVEPNLTVLSGTPDGASNVTPVGTTSVDFTAADSDAISQGTSNFGINNQPASFEMWVSPDASGSGAYVHLGASGGSNGVSVGIGNTTLDGSHNNNIIALIDGVAWKASNQPHNTSGTWTHVIVTLGASNVTFYRDGVQVAQLSTSTWAGSPTVGTFFSVGGYPTSSRYFEGKVGQVSVYDVELDGDTVMLHYGAGGLGMAP